MAGGRKLSLPRLSGVALWMPITALLSLGLLTTLVDYTSVGAREISRASNAQQHFTINAISGEVNLAHEDSTEDGTATPAEEFDVGTAEPSPTSEATAEPEPAATPSNEETAAPAETPPTAETAPHADAPESKKTEQPVAAEAAPTTPSTAEEKTPSASDESSPAQPAASTQVVAATDATPASLINAPTLRTVPLAVELAAPMHTSTSLVPAPAPEVSEKINGLTLPKRGDKGVIPSKLYAQPFTRKPEQALLSFVIMDVGLDPQSIGLVMALPREITVAYSPYSRKTDNYSEHLRAKGHEVWTMLPAMNDRYPADDPGPMGIISRMPPEEVRRRTQEILAAIDGSVGFIIAPNETLTASTDSIAPVLGELSTRGLFFLSTHPTRTLNQLSTNRGMLAGIRRADLLLDATPDESQIKSKLAGVIASANEKGEYVVLLSARPQSLRILAEWLNQNPLGETLALAPLSAIYQPKEAPVATEEAPAEDGHGAPAKKEKPKAKPAEKKPKVLPQDKYLKPTGDAKSGHGGGEKPSSGGH